jgi:hypothetical protein
MTRPRRGAALGLLVLMAVLAAGVLAPADGRPREKAKPPPPVCEPGGTAEATWLAVQQPDEYAWQLFLYLNRQALAGQAGAADPAKAGVRDYDDDRPVVWESWALASADAQLGGSEVFLAKGARPVAWDKLDRGRAPPKKLDRTLTAASHHLPSLPAAVLRPGSFVPLIAPTHPLSDEVRMNRSTFDTIRDNELYNTEGLAAAFQKAVAAGDRDSIQFMPAAKEVKARWVEIDDADKPRHHWRSIGGKTYGLRALHVTTKDLPSWFWCDFIHADLEPGEPPGSTRDATTRGPGAPHGKDGVREETVGSKWQNYRLKGSQTAFTDARGKPTVLGDQLLEFGQAANSSCITCHAMAGIDKDGHLKSATFFTGLPRTADFGDKDIVRLQTDFLYSIPVRAHSTKE